MAVLYVTEFANLGTSNNAQVMQMATVPPLVEQTVAIGGSTTQSSAFGANTTFVRLHTDAICSIAFGTNPSATATTARLAAGTTEYFVVPQNKAFKVAVITNT